VLLDDSYYAGPDSMAADLAILADTPGRKIAVLGDMLELGEIEVEAHRQIGARAREVADVLFTVGPRAAHIAAAARESGHRDVREFASKEGLAAAIVAELRDGDHVLLKASHGVALETVVEELREEDPR
jgi:UDP-N-acetylmuramoyl-tripeptide--D-alanyl-D-alanine ligase